MDWGRLDMAQLKVVKVFEFNENSTDEVEVCIKSEADKEIAEKEYKLHEKSRLLKETKEFLAELQKTQKRSVDNAVKTIRLQKYKRCLDKARWCEERCCRYSLQQEIQGVSWEKEIKFYCKLHDKYMELAEKFRSKNE
jgi:hypothetical protein